jgi:hypothetical protein
VVIRPENTKDNGFDYLFSTDGIRPRSSSKNEAVQIERAASSPTMSTIKRVATLAITFTSIYTVS